MAADPDAERADQHAGDRTSRIGSRSPDARASDYRLARIGAASALTAVVVLLLVLDALLPDYDVDPVVLVSILGTIGALLGIEAVNIVRGPKP